jgi:hypothetical protein
MDRRRSCRRPGAEEVACAAGGAGIRRRQGLTERDEFRRPSEEPRRLTEEPQRHAEEQILE